MQKFETMGYGSDDLIKDSESLIEKAQRYLRKPQTFIICILFCAMTVIGLQFGSMRHELATLHKQVQQESRMEHKLESQMRGVQSELHKVEREERTLQGKEHELEKKIKDNVMDFVHDVQENPTVQHVSEEVSREEERKVEEVKSFGETLMDTMRKIQKPGAAQEHHKASLIPTHNILKPGAHPRSKVDHPKPAHHSPPVHNNHHENNHHAKPEEHHKKEMKVDLSPHKIE